MAFVIPEDVDVFVELDDGRSWDGPLPIHKRFEWEQDVTSLEEREAGLATFRLSNGFLTCDRNEVVEVSSFHRARIDQPFCGWAHS